VKLLAPVKEKMKIVQKVVKHDSPNKLHGALGVGFDFKSYCQPRVGGGNINYLISKVTLNQSSAGADRANPAAPDYARSPSWR